MQIDVMPLLKGETTVVKVCYSTTPPEDFSDVHFNDNIHVDGEVRDMAGYMTVKLTAKVSYTTHCSRCFREISRNFSMDLEKPAAIKGKLEDPDPDEYLFIEKGSIDPDEVLSETLALEIPTVDLCKEDCKGLCAKCGKDLNEGECSCPKKEIDPRLAILGKLLDK